MNRKTDKAIIGACIALAGMIACLLIRIVAFEMGVWP